MSKFEELGDDHWMSNHETPLNKEAIAISDADKIKKIGYHFEKIMEIMGLDLDDDSLKGTPNRVAKMYINEIFSGLNTKNLPKMSLFPNNYQYDGMLVEKDIEVYSTCEHHFVPIIGKAHVAYIAGDNIIGLSKINRIVQFYSKRPQVQERLTIQVLNELKKVLNTEDIACIIEAKHLCVNMRGVRDTKSSTITAKYSGSFNNNSLKQEFLSHVNLDSHFDI
jgi:GTP cyclohydrolase I